MECRNKEKPVVLIVEEIYRKGKEVYDSVADMEIVIAPVAEDLLAEKVIDTNAFAVILGVEEYSSKLYNALKKGNVIARFGVGYDGVDLEKASDNGLYVTNTPEVLESTVAEFTVLLAGEVMRKPGSIDKKMKEGIWNPFMGKEFWGKTWAILGLGKIGKKLSQILSFGFGVNVIACEILNVDPIEVKEKYGVTKVSSEFTEIIPFADIVSLHIPANKDTRHFLNGERLGLFKPGSILINTGRGALIDEYALYDVLEKNHISGAGLDVFENEPYFPVDPNKDLRKSSNVVLTPHIASSTTECSKRIAERTIQNIRYALERKYEFMDIVNRLNYFSARD